MSKQPKNIKVLQQPPSSKQKNRFRQPKAKKRDPFVTIAGGLGAGLSPPSSKPKPKPNNGLFSSLYASLTGADSSSAGSVSHYDYDYISGSYKDHDDTDVGPAPTAPYYDHTLRRHRQRSRQQGLVGSLGDGQSHYGSYGGHKKSHKGHHKCHCKGKGKGRIGCKTSRGREGGRTLSVVGMSTDYIILSFTSVFS